ncbi:MAG: creatininase family protein, partial [Desulfobacteraceae bacterium]
MEILGVIQRLEVGPIRLEKRRLIAPYTVTQNGQVDSTELIYRFEEDVFKSDEPESLNLASMISAQVALNYGLFSDEMVFHGWFEDADQRFLRGMAENTAREIFVKKFLEPNPFLRRPAGELSAV